MRVIKRKNKSEMTISAKENGVPNWVSIKIRQGKPFREETAKWIAEAIGRPKDQLFDVHEDQDRTFQYLLACSEAQIYPSVMGLATFGFGISRQALNRWLSRNIESEAAQFILEVKDVMADVLTNAALYRNADAAMAIFQLKNHFEHADAVQIEIPQEAGPLGQKMDQRELERRISESVVLDE